VLGRRRSAGSSLAGAALVAALLGACTEDRAATETSSAPSGELTLLSLGPVATWDPQRMSTPQDIAVAGRLFMRTLTAHPPGGDAVAQRQVVGDLAVDAGDSDPSLTVWTFRLRDGITWQDGSPVTCEDVRYGVSRSFAAPFAEEGLNYPLAYLAIPRRADGTSTYEGPYSKVGQAAYDKAVTCEGNAVTFRLSAPLTDFNQLVALPVFAPYPAARDQRGEGAHEILSTGPYQLEGAWDPSAGGTFVRNPEWDATSDPLRKALPQRIRYIEGTESQTAAQQVIDDDGAHRQAITLDSAPPAMQQQVLSDPALKARSINPAGPFVDYLAPSVTTGVMKDPGVRTAFALATNREGYVTALGGASTADAAYSLVGPAVPGHRTDDVVGGGSTGDTAEALATLHRTGRTLPVPVRVAYRSTPTADKAMAALVNGWEAAGFAIELQPIEDDYFAAISEPGRTRETDVFWANWAPAWPSASTVIPPLFESRLNLSDSGTGRDFGAFADARVNTEIARIAALKDPAQQAEAWSRLDASLVERVAYIALAQRRSLYLAGSAVTGLSANEALGGFVDLATVGVE
jgi:peptide/nickel transport system substrate-binding protein